MTRWITGVLLLIFVVAVIQYAPLSLIQFLILLISILCLVEYAQMMFVDTHPVYRLFFVAVGSALSGAVIFLSFCRSHFLGMINCLLMLCFMMHVLFARDVLKSSLDHLLAFFFGVLYLSLPFYFLTRILQLPNHLFWIYTLLIGTIAADTGGYVFGKLFGKRKLAPKISPGKTVEGFIGGILFTIVGTFLVRFILSPEYPWFFSLTLACLIACIAPMGDLSESLIKRAKGVKDSGHIIPGHGGVLDRVDALLFTAPLVYYLERLGHFFF